MLDLAEVRLILSARPPHRLQPGASIDHRLRMLALATRGRRGLRADDREVRRATRPSYTVDTLCEVRQERGPSQALIWCIGWDAFVELETWKDWSRLIDLAHLAVFRRPGADTRLPPAMDELVARHGCQDPALLAREANGRVIVLEAQMLPISATEVRAKLARHADVEGLLPPAVWSYIRRHRLYGG